MKNDYETVLPLLWKNEREEYRLLICMVRSLNVFETVFFSVSFVSVSTLLVQYIFPTHIGHWAGLVARVFVFSSLESGHDRIQQSNGHA